MSLLRDEAHQRKADTRSQVLRAESARIRLLVAIALAHAPKIRILALWHNGVRTRQRYHHPCHAVSATRQELISSSTHSARRALLVNFDNPTAHHQEQQEATHDFHVMMVVVR